MKWKNGDKIGQIIVGGNNQLDQLNSPMNVIVDKRRDCLLICDVRNKRIIQWSRQKRINDQVTISNIKCYGLALDDEGYLYFADYINHAVKRWRMNDSTGEIVAGGNGEGDRLDQLHHPTYIFVDKEHSIYVSDQSNHRVMKWSNNAKEGIVVAGGQGQGDSLTQLSNPNAIFVDQLGTVYVADSSNNRIICWTKGASEGRVVVGGNGIGGNSNQLRYPMGLSFDRSGNLYVSDTNNHRVQKFHVDSTLNF
jgi:sugar lactone lactonase YvrE